MTHTERLINLLTFLLHSRQPVPWYIIRERMQEYKESKESTALRMFERDKAELKEIGVQIHYDGEGYLIPEEYYYLPEVGLTPDEALLLQVCTLSLRKTPGFNRIPEVTSAVHKAIFDSTSLSPSKYVQAMEKYYILHFSSEVDNKRISKLVSLLFDAIFKKKCVSMEYYAIGEDKKSARTVEPYGMLLRKGIWYLVARDVEKKDIRVYKIARIHRISVNKKYPEKPDFTVPQNFKIINYLGRRPWDLSKGEESTEIKVKYSPEIAWWVKENFGDTNEVKMNPDGSCTVNFKVNSIEPFIRWTMRIDNMAEILSPSHIREEIKNAFSEVLKKYL